MRIMSAQPQRRSFDQDKGFIVGRTLKITSSAITKFKSNYMDELFGEVEKTQLLRVCLNARKSETLEYLKSLSQRKNRLGSAKPLLKKKYFISSNAITNWNPSITTQLKSEVASPKG